MLIQVSTDCVEINPQRIVNTFHLFIPSPVNNISDPRRET